MPGTLTISTLSDGTNSTSSTNCIQGSAKAWVNFNGVSGSVAIRASYNVSSITRNAAGDYTINFTNAFTDANYSCVGQAHYPSVSNHVFQAPTISSANQTTTSVRAAIPLPNTGANQDASFIQVAIFR